MNARVTVVTSGHLSTCPRMLKAADAFSEEGYAVRVISTRHIDWATSADADIARARRWRWDVVDYDRASGPITYLRTGARFHAARRLAGTLMIPTRGAAPSRRAAAVPLAVAARAFSRAHDELVKAIAREPADFVYGGTTGALAALAAGARRLGVPYALDLEDFHSGEHEETGEGRLANALARRIEHAVLPRARFRTAASTEIARAYEATYAVRTVPVHNTFPLPDRPPGLPSDRHGLRLYWFSQTIGLGRGLEDAVRAMGLASLDGELHVRGKEREEDVAALRRLAAEVAPGLTILTHPPAPPDQMVAMCRDYDVGLAAEEATVFNRTVCLTNKALTYPLAGLAVVLADLPGQRELARDLGPGAVIYRPGDVHALASGLCRWARDRALLARARGAAWEAARRRWHWHHPADRGALVAELARVWASA